VATQLARRDEEPTKVLVADRRDATALGASLASLTMTPLQTLRFEEIERTRVFCRIALAVAGAVIVATPFISGDPIAELLMIGGLSLVVVSTGWLAWRIRDDDGYDERRVLTTAYAIIVGVFTGVYYFGVFSPAAVIFPFGIYFFSLAQSFRATLSVFLSCAVGYAAMALAVMSGALADRAVMSGDGVAAFDKLAMLAIVESVLVATFVLGRATRRASLAGVEKHDVAIRRLTQRDALLREAREELELALQVGGVGRYTDMDLGSFRLGQVIGRGGMGEVYEATRIADGSAAAVKVLQRHMLGDPDSVRRFIREARAVEKLDVANVVTVLEVGEYDAITPYIAMERLRGRDLGEVLRERRQLSLRRTIELLAEVGHGLAAARAHGIVHRDLKPRNLFHADVDGAGRVWKILDFGVAKQMDGQATLTRGDVVGTPAYMAPEQATGGKVTHRTDLYALGVIAYRTLTGRPAFTGQALSDMVYKVVHQMPPRPSEANPALPAGVDDVLAVAMAKDAADRFDSADELIAAFEAVVRARVDADLAARAERLGRAHPWGRMSPNDSLRERIDDTTMPS
jgi:serine/threonine-protein kinase